MENKQKFYTTKTPLGILEKNNNSKSFEVFADIVSNINNFIFSNRSLYKSTWYWIELKNSEYTDYYQICSLVCMTNDKWVSESFTNTALSFFCDELINKSKT